MIRKKEDRVLTGRQPWELRSCELVVRLGGGSALCRCRATDAITCLRKNPLFPARSSLGDGDNPLVFPMRSGRPIAPSTLPKMFKYHRIPAVAHGFRSSFRDWAAEETAHPREVIEAALAHVVQNKVEAAYARSDLFERWRPLMDDWGTYLAGGGQ